jgi:hypothetical protein
LVAWLALAAACSGNKFSSVDGASNGGSSRGGSSASGKGGTSHAGRGSATGGSGPEAGAPDEGAAAGVADESGGTTNAGGKGGGAPAGGKGGKRASGGSAGMEATGGAAGSAGMVTGAGGSSNAGGTANGGAGGLVNRGGQPGLGGHSGSGGHNSAGNGGASGSVTAGVGGTGGIVVGTGGLGGDDLFREDFESENPLAAWSNGSSQATHTIESGGATPGSAHHLHIDGSDNYFLGLNYTFSTPLEPSVVRYWTRVSSSTSRPDAYFALSSAANGAGQIVYLRLVYSLSAQATALSSSLDPSWTTYEDGTTLLDPDVWYQVEIDIDWNAGNYSVKLDGYGLPNTTTSFSSAGILRIDLFTENSGEADFDDIEFVR